MLLDVPISLQSNPLGHPSTSRASSQFVKMRVENYSDQVHLEVCSCLCWCCWRDALKETRGRSFENNCRTDRPGVRKQGRKQRKCAFLRGNGYIWLVININSLLSKKCRLLCVEVGPWKPYQSCMGSETPV